MIKIGIVCKLMQTVYLFHFYMLFESSSLHIIYVYNVGLSKPYNHDVRCAWRIAFLTSSKITHELS